MRDLLLPQKSTSKSPKGRSPFTRVQLPKLTWELLENGAKTTAPFNVRLYGQQTFSGEEGPHGPAVVFEEKRGHQGTEKARRRLGPDRPVPVQTFVRHCLCVLVGFCPSFSSRERESGFSPWLGLHPRVVLQSVCVCPAQKATAERKHPMAPPSMALSRVYVHTGGGGEEEDAPLSTPELVYGYLHPEGMRVHLCTVGLEMSFALLFSSCPLFFSCLASPFSPLSFEKMRGEERRFGKTLEIFSLFPSPDACPYASSHCLPRLSSSSLPPSGLSSAVDLFFCFALFALMRLPHPLLPLRGHSWTDRQNS